ncbi:MAG: hypothetical protein A2528_03695 [Candidatus Staskawiczbacteria bacterium RIFOXYD2_FULL_37_9]|uniref:Uncharacterized protein n=1 Tax=Candidatus Staskawiczbacteria bacterium RIFOXYB1_FULL_37_44 TaxID=1802223 RepID=A0A1G2IYI4_9BACT|nr:MAG: hypothetical protein A2358_00350 [Candidatus Staskawiczbacteria bacterium RIFOXYB1_FULL_37_44]OGZ83465.1 MAG: hypothetical protein A2416_04015 [Candidatus Staskawiczbacteria bacterium RIFOXYC1_FULL_37_52]OGZ88485.1 MAG: hypothetical protein A2444_02635 [Candidatus Staskawiczbacteria bacterium RIFOXYC2_FULL_37_19]OGZ90197.1 MAG: hypothetical protein A2581_02190 [Candidatus Staskawiczbacteria bacterium RIFOXYD1_FULL_37_110]OGZ93214.1 MAG: hypothetical protein A2528_03695 [Candidatus Stask
MLDNNDIEKLIKAQKEVFVTKDEFKSFIEIAAKKDDIAEMRKDMATKDDIKGIKGDVNKIVDLLGKMDGKLDEVVQTSKEVEYIKNMLAIPVLKK